MDRRKLLALTALSPLAAPAMLRGAISPAAAQAPWPNRQIRMVIPWPPGQATDVVGRLAGQRLSERLGQVVVPENRPGAGGQIGTDLVAKAPPDGNVILSASIGPISFSPLVQRTPYDAERELAPVVIFGIAPFMLLVKPDFPAQDLRSFMALVKSIPGKYSYNSSGIGGAQHLVCALFLAKAGLDALHVPFQGSGPALAALLGGQVDIPPVAAVGGPADYDVGGWNGLMVPAGTPRPIIDRIYTEIRDGMAVPEVRQRYESVGFDVDPMGPEAMLQHMRKLWGEFGPLIRQLGIRAE